MYNKKVIKKNLTAERRTLRVNIKMCSIMNKVQLVFYKFCCQKRVKTKMLSVNAVPTDGRKDKPNYRNSSTPKNNIFVLFLR